MTLVWLSYRLVVKYWLKKVSFVFGDNSLWLSGTIC